MAAIEKINQDITTLKKSIVAITQEVRSLYSSYLTALGQAVRQQLIMASYHLCTQAYPETFLSLSVDQQQHLQQALRQLGQQVEQQLRSYLQLFFAESPELTVDELENLGQAPARLEKAIAEELRRISRAANHLLQNCGILPSAALEVLLEIAAKAEESGSAISGPPNLLTALIETRDSSTSDDTVAEQTQATSRVTPEANEESLSSEDATPDSPETLPESVYLSHNETLDNAAGTPPTPAAIVAIYLRLDEIEFADSTVMAWRSQIRRLSAKLTSSLQELEKKQRERIIAEAQAAWRSSWSG